MPGPATLVIKDEVNVKIEGLQLVGRMHWDKKMLIMRITKNRGENER